MVCVRKITINNKEIDAVSIPLGDKNLIVLRGEKGYVMCGYLNMAVANSFGDVAIKITGISTIEQAMQTTVKECSHAAKKLGISEGQIIKDILPHIL